MGKIIKDAIHADGKAYQFDYYIPDEIISVGYRVKPCVASSSRSGQSLISFWKSFIYFS